MGEHAGKLIKGVHSSGQYKSQGKASNDMGLDDVFTIADITVQKTIEYNIKQLFPYVNIISEEDSKNTESIKPTLQPDELVMDIVSEQMLADSFRKRKSSLTRYIHSENGLGTDIEEEALHFYYEDMTLWIDPLDGTKSFSTG